MGDSDDSETAPPPPHLHPLSSTMTRSMNERKILSHIDNESSIEVRSSSVNNKVYRDYDVKGGEEEDEDDEEDDGEETGMMMITNNDVIMTEEHQGPLLNVLRDKYTQSCMKDFGPSTNSKCFSRQKYDEFVDSLLNTSAYENGPDEKELEDLPRHLRGYALGSAENVCLIKSDWISHCLNNKEIENESHSNDKLLHHHKNHYLWTVRTYSSSQCNTGKYRRVIPIEDFFDLLFSLHKKPGPKGGTFGQKKLFNTLKDVYAGVPRDAVDKFVAMWRDSPLFKPPLPANANDEISSEETVLPAAPVGAHFSGVSMVPMSRITDVLKDFCFSSTTPASNSAKRSINTVNANNDDNDDDESLEDLDCNSLTKKARLNNSLLDISRPVPEEDMRDLLAAHNLFVRRMVDMTLDRTLSLSAQPQDRVRALEDISRREFPQLEAIRHRTKIGNYLKSCRKSLAKYKDKVYVRPTPPHTYSSKAREMALEAFDRNRSQLETMRINNVSDTGDGEELSAPLNHNGGGGTVDSADEQSESVPTIISRHHHSHSQHHHHHSSLSSSTTTRKTNVNEQLDRPLIDKLDKRDIKCEDVDDGNFHSSQQQQPPPPTHRHLLRGNTKKESVNPFYHHHQHHHHSSSDRSECGENNISQQHGGGGGILSNHDNERTPTGGSSHKITDSSAAHSIIPNVFHQLLASMMSNSENMTAGMGELFSHRHQQQQSTSRPSHSTAAGTIHHSSSEGCSPPSLSNNNNNNDALTELLMQCLTHQQQAPPPPPPLPPSHQQHSTSHHHSSTSQQQQQQAKSLLTGLNSFFGTMLHAASGFGSLPPPPPPTTVANEITPPSPNPSEFLSMVDSVFYRQVMENREKAFDDLQKLTAASQVLDQFISRIKNALIVSDPTLIHSSSSTTGANGSGSGGGGISSVGASLMSRLNTTTTNPSTNVFERFLNANLASVGSTGGGGGGTAGSNSSTTSGGGGGNGIINCLPPPPSSSSSRNLFSSSSQNEATNRFLSASRHHSSSYSDVLSSAALLIGSTTTAAATSATPTATTTATGSSFGVSNNSNGVAPTTSVLTGGSRLNNGAFDGLSGEELAESLSSSLRNRVAGAGGGSCGTSSGGSGGGGTTVSPPPLPSSTGGGGGGPSSLLNGFPPALAPHLHPHSHFAHNPFHSGNAVSRYPL